MLKRGAASQSFMNSEEYQRAIKDTRKAIYKGNLSGALLGALRAMVAKNDPGEPSPRRIEAREPLRLPAKRKVKTKC